jgi:hypothetical protein
MTIEELQAEAERLFPFPIRCCVFARKKILYLREKWVAERIKKADTNQ